jgi:hypothetical protein
LGLYGANREENSQKAHAKRAKTGRESHLSPKMSGKSAKVHVGLQERVVNGGNYLPIRAILALSNSQTKLGL